MTVSETTTAAAVVDTPVPTREERFLAEGVIRALKLGLVPQRGVERVVVGRRREMDQMRRDLEYVAQGGAGVKFLSGDYGSGKTFLCSMLREAAWEQGMVVSVVDLGRNVALHKLETVYQQVMAGMRTRELPGTPAFDSLVQQWLYGLEDEVQRTEGLDPLKDEDRPVIATHVERRIQSALAQVSVFDSSFANAFRGYYAAIQREDGITADAALGWLKGEQNIPQELKGRLHVKGGVSRANAFAFLRAMNSLLLSMGYKGLVILFDETELVRGLNRADLRQAAYENIKMFLDRSAMGDLPHVYALFAGTEDLFADEQKGIPSYQALHDRIRPRHPGIADGTVQEVRGAILRLDGFSRDRLIEVAIKVRDLHGRAYAWEPVHRLDEAFLADFADHLATRFGKAAPTFPRGFLKTLVDLLDLCEQDTAYDPRRDFAPSERTVAAIQAVEEQEAHLLDF